MYDPLYSVPRQRCSSRRGRSSPRGVQHHNGTIPRANPKQQRFPEDSTRAMDMALLNNLLTRLGQLSQGTVRGKIITDLEDHPIASAPSYQAPLILNPPGRGHAKLLPQGDVNSSEEACSTPSHDRELSQSMGVSVPGAPTISHPGRDVSPARASLHDIARHAGIWRIRSEWERCHPLSSSSCLPRRVTRGWNGAACNALDELRELNAWKSLNAWKALDSYDAETSASRRPHSAPPRASQRSPRLAQDHPTEPPISSPRSWSDERAESLPRKVKQLHGPIIKGAMKHLLGISLGNTNHLTLLSPDSEEAAKIVRFYELCGGCKGAKWLFESAMVWRIENRRLYEDYCAVYLSCGGEYDEHLMWHGTRRKRTDVEPSLTTKLQSIASAGLDSSRTAPSHAPGIWLSHRPIANFGTGAKKTVFILCLALTTWAERAAIGYKVLNDDRVLPLYVIKHDAARQDLS